MFKFKIGDTVKITRGKDKGREGTIEKIFPSGQKVLLPGINIYKKHLKKVTSRDGKGGIFDIPRPLSFASVTLICPNCKKATRVEFRIMGREKLRVCKKCKKGIDIKKA
ncbi:50S ribosomal protein L24 [Candidatus Woesebacteria bacterium]|nr:50S ribosomal protein L24 [Candidatus Woesebacteria bacterium]